MNLFWQFEPVKVEFYLDNGYTKVFYVRLVGLQILDDWFTDVATSLIPPNWLSLFALVAKYLQSRKFN